MIGGSDGSTERFRRTPSLPGGVADPVDERLAEGLGLPSGPLSVTFRNKPGQDLAARAGNW